VYKQFVIAHMQGCLNIEKVKNKNKKKKHLFRWFMKLF